MPGRYGAVDPDHDADSIAGVMKFGVDPVHFGMIMLMNLGIGLCHPLVRRLRRRTRADGKRDEGDLAVLWGHVPRAMAVAYIPAISLWLPRALSL